MDTEKFESVKRFVATAVSVAIGPLTQKLQNAVRETNARMAAHGAATSSGAIHEAIRFRTEMASELLQTQFDAFIEGSELNELQIDDEVGAAVIENIELARSYLVSDARNSLPAELLPPQRSLIAPNTLSSIITERMESTTGNLMAKFRLDIQRANLKSRRPQNAQRASITNIYHLAGYDSRVNVNSVDNSTNVTTLSADQVFTTLRDELSEGIARDDERRGVLRALEKLQDAQNTSTFAHRYTEFISVAADHMTLIAPFIPALTELLRRSIS